MPKVYVENGFRFFFFSNEGIPQEPCHIHVRKGEGLAKIWIDPDVKLADSVGFTAGELKRILESVERNKELIKEAWNEYFN